MRTRTAGALAAGRWPATEPEPVQFWLSNLPADTPLATLACARNPDLPLDHPPAVFVASSGVVGRENGRSTPRAMCPWIRSGS